MDRWMVTMLLKSPRAESPVAETAHGHDICQHDAITDIRVFKSADAGNSHIECTGQSVIATREEVGHLIHFPLGA